MPRLTSRIAALTLALAAGRLAAEPAVVSLARAYLGPESTLNSIRSIHYIGTLERTDPANPSGPPKVESLDMVLSKPMQQKLVQKNADTTLTTVLDDMEGWSYAVDNTNPNRHRLVWMNAPDILMLQANTLENLYYYQMPRGQGTAVDKGPATMDGVACERVDITHDGGITFERYFDRDTGRLVLSKVGTEEIRESGEIMVDGLKFPTQITTRATGADGKPAIATAKFTKVTINEAIPSTAFDAPALTPALPEPAAAPAATPAAAVLPATVPAK